jgi:hypothetical protein
VQFFRKRAVVVFIAIVTLVGFTAGGVALYTASNSTPSVDKAQVIANLADAELQWYAQPQDVKDQICNGLASTPDEYYALMKQTWLESGMMDEEMFAAFITTIIDDCGL